MHACMQTHNNACFFSRTSLGLWSLLKRGCAQRGQRILLSVGRKTNASQPTQPWICSSTAFAFASNTWSSFSEPPCLCKKIGRSAASIVASVLVVHPLVRWAVLRSCHSVPFCSPPRSQTTSSPSPKTANDAITRDARPAFSNTITPPGCVAVGFFKNVF